MDWPYDTLDVTKSIRRLLPMLLLATATAASAGVLPTGQPEYDFLYERIVRQQVLHPDQRDFQISPYSSSLWRRTSGPFSSWLNDSDGKLQLFGFAAEDFSTARHARATAFESLRAGVRGQPFARVDVYADFVLDEELAKDPAYSGKKWRGFAGDVDQAFVSYESDRFMLRAGRFGACWGPPRSLIFSPEQKLDGFAYSLRWGKLAVSYRLAGLDGLNPDEHPVEQYEPRYVAAHRFDWHFSDRARIGLFETVVFGGPGRQIDLFYLNPLIFFHGSQLNENLNDNTLVGFDFDIHPLDHLKTYGQLVIDDIQLDDKSRGDREPDEYGLLLGGYLADLGPGIDLRVQHERVTNWTFNQMHERNRYLNDGRPIGDVLGNDYDLTSVTLLHWWREVLQGGLEFSYCRRGEGRVDAPWTEPWVEADDEYSEPFPTGVVERTTRLALGVKGFLFHRALLDLQTGVDWKRNQGHTEGNSLTLPFVRLYLSLFGLADVAMD